MRQYSRGGNFVELIFTVNLRYMCGANFCEGAEPLADILDTMNHEVTRDFIAEIFQQPGDRTCTHSELPFHEIWGRYCINAPPKPFTFLDAFSFA